MRLFAGLLLLLALAACRSLPAPLPPLPLLPPQALGNSLAFTQKVSGGSGTQHDVMLVQAEVDTARLAMAGSTATGQVLFRLQLTAAGLQAERAAWAPAAIDPARILADCQLAFWPLDAIRTALPAGYRLDEAADGLSRTLWYGDERISSIRYGARDRWSQPVQFTQHRWRYQLTIETLSAEPL